MGTIAAQPARQTVARALKNPDKFLSKYGKEERSLRFEQLVAQGFAHLLHLPFFDIDDDQTSIPQRVTWRGSERNLQAASAGSDAVARAHGFHLLVEATEKTSGKQLTQEFSQCLEHAEQFVATECAEPAHVHICLVPKKLHPHTYTVARNASSTVQFRVIPMEPAVLAHAIDTSSEAFTVTHADICRLFTDIADSMERTTKADKFRQLARRVSDEWRKSVFLAERDFLVALRAYEAMLTEGAGPMGASAVHRQLLADKKAMRYLRVIESEDLLGPRTVADWLLSQRLAYPAGKEPYTGEQILRAVPAGEFCFRSDRCRGAVEEIYAKSVTRLTF